jgi:hypothetical protein
MSANHYCHTLRKLCTKIKSKHGKYTDHVIPLNNNACPHVAHWVQEKLCIMVWQEAFKQRGLTTMHLSYVWDLKALKVISENSVWETEVPWFKQQPKELFVDGIHWPVHEWDCCACVIGDFFKTVALYSFLYTFKWASIVHVSYLVIGLIQSEY